MLKRLTTCAISMLLLATSLQEKVGLAVSLSVPAQNLPQTNRIADAVQPISTPSGQWTFVDNQPNTTTFGNFLYPPFELDIDPVFTRNLQYRVIWTRAVFNYPAVFANTKYMMSNQVIDCNNHSIRNQALIFLNIAGGVTLSSGATQFAPILSGTMNDELFNLVCSQ